MTSSSLALEKGLPAAIDAEKFVLGSILLDDSAFLDVAGVLSPDDFCLDKHRKIFRRMSELHERSERIDRVTVANELMKFNELESVDGVTYLVSLDDGLPRIPNLDSYVKIIRDKATLRRIISAAQQTMNRALLGEEEPDVILAGAEESLVQLGESRMTQGLKTPGEIIADYAGGINAFLDPSRRIKGISTGFTKLDEMTGGLHKGELVILAARPSMGKTAIALNIASHVACKLNEKVAIFSLEMSGESLLTRMLCASAYVDSQRFRAGYLNQDERRKLAQASQNLVEAPLYIDDTAGVNLMDMHAKLRRLQNGEQKLGLVIVDYLQLMSARGRSENRNQEVSGISRGLKLMAKELDVPMMVLSQLSRAPETRIGDHRPQLSDLRESGCLTGDTLVTVACDGSQVPIRDLMGRRMCVHALDEKSLKTRPVQVERVFNTGVKPVFRLTTRLGRSIRATANHKFLAWNGWKRLDELLPGEPIALPRFVRSGEVQTMRNGELALLGHLLGDGCTLPRHAIQYTTKDRDLAELVAQLAAECFDGEVEPRIVAERRWFQVYLSSTRRHTHGVGSAVSDWLRELGAWGYRAYEKRVPAVVFTQPVPAIALFLKHLWSTDGCIHMGQASPHVYYATSSRGLAQDVQSLLLRLGINARITRVSQKGKGRDQYPVHITGKPDLEGFIRLVGAAGSRKQTSLNAVAAHLNALRGNTNRDVLPAKIWKEFALPGMVARKITSRGLAAEMGTAYCGASLYSQNVSRERAARVAQIVGSERLARLAVSDIYWDPILSIEPDGEEETFDLTVPEHHNFVANDFFVHNSIEQDADLVGFIFREEVYKRDRADLHGLAELIIAKQRNGPIGTVNLVYLHAMTKFENRADEPADSGE
jgi:replicative DNA helicase